MSVLCHGNMVAAYSDYDLRFVSHTCSQTLVTRGHRHTIQMKCAPATILGHNEHDQENDGQYTTESAVCKYNFGLAPSVLPCHFSSFS